MTAKFMCVTAQHSEALGTRFAGVRRGPVLRRLSIHVGRRRLSGTGLTEVQPDMIRLAVIPTEIQMQAGCS
jgi:hypothetical protein